MMMMIQLAQIPGVNLANVEKYVVDCSNDPSFQGFFPMAGQQGMSGAQCGMMGGLMSAQQGGGQPGAGQLPAPQNPAPQQQGV
jgi:hypothetical protein